MMEGDAAGPNDARAPRSRPFASKSRLIDRSRHMTIFNLDKHHLTASETMFVGANASVIGRTRLGNSVGVWPGAVTRGSASALSEASKSNRLRFARAEP